MPRFLPVVPVQFSCLVLLAPLSMGIQLTHGQDGRFSASGTELIPPGNVISVRRERIVAQAEYLRAAGEFMVSAAEARNLNAQATKKEIENHADWVRTYFELKELNKAYYLKEHPSYVERAEKRQAQLERAIVNNPQLVLHGDVGAETLNWLLDKIASTALAMEAMEGARGRRSVVDHYLTFEECQHIVLTDGAHAGGEKITFRAHEAKAMETPWPFVLRGPEYQDFRRAFELNRDESLGQMTESGKIHYETQKRLKVSVDELMLAFQKRHPWQRRHMSPEAYREYSRGKQFLQSLALSVARVIETNDRQVFDGSLRFEGNNVLDLVRHLCRHGLEFGPPGAGDQRVYTKLYLAMRDIFLGTIPDAAEVEVPGASISTTPNP